MNNENNKCEYKGKFHKQTITKMYYEGGAHFKASELFLCLIELQKEKYLLTAISTQPNNINKDTIQHHKVPSLFIQKKDRITLDLRDIFSDQLHNNPHNNIRRKKPEPIVLRQKTELSIIDKSSKIKHHRHVNSFDPYNHNNCNNNNNELNYMHTDINANTNNYRQINKCKRIININSGKKLCLLPHSINSNISGKSTIINEDHKSRKKLPKILKIIPSNLKQQNEKSYYYV